MRSIRVFVLAALFALTTSAFAADFDGSKLLICAPVTGADCMRGDDCISGLPGDMGAPSFMRLDFANRAVVGPATTSAILLLEKQQSHLLLQGREGEFAWTISLEATSGEMTMIAAGRNRAYVFFGACTPI